MARAMWSGAISFGMVSVPVKLYTAVSRKSIRFNQIDSATNSRVKQKRVNSEGEEVPYDRIVKGYEVSKGSYVIISEDELLSVAPKASRMIEISDFVSEEEIDPIFYDSAYHLVPDELAQKPYALLVRSLTETQRVAIAKVVMRTKEYLVALRPCNGMLTMSTMSYPDEVVVASDLPGAEDFSDFELKEAEVEMATQLIDSLTTTFELESYTDSHREKLLEMIEQKAAGEMQEITVPDSDDAEIVNLMAALEASVAAAKAKQEATDEPDAKTG